MDQEIPPGTRSALIDIADTAESCLLWFRARQAEGELAFTGGDVLRMTQMVLDRRPSAYEEDLERARERVEMREVMAELARRDLAQRGDGR